MKETKAFFGSITKGSAGLAAVAFVCGLPAWGQYTSNLRGAITDPSGASIVGASVVLESVQTGAKQSSTTDGSGNYRFSSLAPGAFRITVTATG